MTFELARCWYGYGRWGAPYWFVGPEPGMAADENRDSLARRTEAWFSLGGGELLDCIAHHKNFGYEKWHEGARPPLQPTWRQLIRLLLSFKGVIPANAMIREYQRDLWATSAGETCAVELSSLAAQNLRVSRDRSTFREERIAFLHSQMRRMQPRFVVMYGTAQKREWEQIVGGPFDDDRMRTINRTVAMLTPHPQARGVTNQQWVDFGLRLRKRCDSLPPET